MVGICSLVALEVTFLRVYKGCGRETLLHLGVEVCPVLCVGGCGADQNLVNYRGCMLYLFISLGR